MPTETPTVPVINTPKPSKAPNKTLLIVVAVIVILLLASAAYMLLGKSSKNGSSNTSKTATSNSSQTNNNKSANTMSKKSLKDLFTGGQNLSCTVSYDANGNTQTGTVYITKGKYYAQFSGTTDGKPYTVYMMSDGSYSYVWSSAETQGFRTKVTNQDQIDAQNSVDLNQQENTKCSNWTVDNSKFTPPANITFTDYTIPTSTVPSYTP